MSNEVGELYSSVIDTVMREARAEFEESGDDPYVLETLKTAWKKRLMDMNITRRPLWVEPRADGISEGSSLPNVATGDMYTNGVKLPTQDVQDVLAGGAAGTDNLLYNLQNKPTQYGGLGGLSSLSSQNGGQENLGSSQPFDILASNSRAPGSMPPQGSIPGVVPTNTLAYNPLDTSKSSSKDNGNQFNISPELHAQLQNAMNKGEGGYVPQNDGLDDELNSDLDDSEDELNSNDEEEDADQTQLMVCLYEKVHKVKTRWKYTLKDGVANVNGLDYVFNKATGESEW